MSDTSTTAGVRWTRGLAGAALVVSLALTGCSAGDMSGHDMSSSESGAGQSDASHNDADVMFVEQMLPHHDQAISMSDLLLAKTGVDQPVRTLAEDIKANQQPEIDLMNGLLGTWNPAAPASPAPHSHGGTHGMLDEMQMKALDEAEGRAGQDLFLTAMTAHHEGAIAMAQTQLDEGKNPEARALAEKVIATQQREVQAMRALLRR